MSRTSQRKGPGSKSVGKANSTGGNSFAGSKASGNMIKTALS